MILISNFRSLENFGITISTAPTTKVSSTDHSMVTASDKAGVLTPKRCCYKRVIAAPNSVST